MSTECKESPSSLYLSLRINKMMQYETLLQIGLINLKLLWKGPVFGSILWKNKYTKAYTNILNYQHFLIVLKKLYFTWTIKERQIEFCQHKIPLDKWVIFPRTFSCPISIYCITKLTYFLQMSVQNILHMIYSLLKSLNDDKNYFCSKSGLYIYL